MEERSLWAWREHLKNELTFEPPPPAALTLYEHEPPMPERFQSYRMREDGVTSHQWDAICEIVEAFERGAKVVMVEAPTGAGKTLIAESVRRLLETRGVFTCTSLNLQDQVERDFGDYAVVLKGRANYPTLDNPAVSADECTREKATLPACTNCPGWTKGSSWGSGVDTEVQDLGGDFSYEDESAEVDHCAFCHPVSQCPYETTKKMALRARLAILNTAYLLAETNFVRKSGFRDHPFVIIDEADTLEEQLLRFVEVQVTPGIRKLLGVGLPKLKTVDESWVEWIQDEVMPALKEKMQEVNSRQMTLDGVPDLDTIKLKKRLVRISQEIGKLLDIDEDGNPTLQSGWVYTGYEGKDDDELNITVTFKPITVDKYAHEVLWDMGQRFLVMSATFISPESRAEQWGLEDDEWEYVEVDYSFSPMRRPVFPVLIGQVNNKNKYEMYPKMVDEIEGIMEDHPDSRILVHTNSYDLTRAVYFGIRDLGSVFRDRACTYLNAKERNEALKKYHFSDNAVLFAPSFDRGIDLPDDECRVQVICKVPFPYLGDKQISSRFYGTGYAGKVWYQMEAIATIIQQTGRGMRHEEDHCRTYILDSAFARMWREHRKLFPGWWADAVVWDENDPKWEGLIG